MYNQMSEAERIEKTKCKLELLGCQLADVNGWCSRIITRDGAEQYVNLLNGKLTEKYKNYLMAGTTNRLELKNALNNFIVLKVGLDKVQVIPKYGDKILEFTGKYYSVGLPNFKGSKLIVLSVTRQKEVRHKNTVAISLVDSTHQYVINTRGDIVYVTDEIYPMTVSRIDHSIDNEKNSSRYRLYSISGGLMIELDEELNILLNYSDKRIKELYGKQGIQHFKYSYKTKINVGTYKDKEKLTYNKSK